MPLLPATKVPKAGHKSKWTGLAGSGMSLAIAESSQQFDGLTLVLTDNPQTASQLRNELVFYTSGRVQILNFADWETLPYDLFSPHQDIISERLFTLSQLAQTRQAILVAPINSLMHRLPPAEYIERRTFLYRNGEKLDLARLRQQLERGGYNAVDTVYEHGEFAVRGSLVDIFPMGQPLPFRIDLFDDEIDSLRLFDPETQRTVKTVSEISILPAREIPLDEASIERFKDNWHLQFDVDHRNCPVYQSIKGGMPPQGIEYYLPLFFEKTALLFDYLPEQCQFFTSGAIEPAAQLFWQEVNERYREYSIDPTRPILPPAKVFSPVEELFGLLKKHHRCELYAAPDDGVSQLFDLAPVPDIAIDDREKEPLAKLSKFLKPASSTAQHSRILFCAESAGRREALLELLAKLDCHPAQVDNWQAFCEGSDTFSITTYPIDRGMQCGDPRITVISETDLFGQQVMQKRRRGKQKQQSDQVIRNLTELNLGAPVVHLHHGVGRYLGLQTITAGGETQEFLTLNYADDTKLYVPVSSLHLISRYSGAEASLAPLHRLGSEQWQRAKDKAVKQIRDTAAELLDIYAKRAANKGFACDLPGNSYRAFCADFPFEETADQHDTIKAVERDMLAEQPMDRLVCGDVGFGKTEVAMRAAFIAVSSGKQVVMLVPTTLLAHQHVENFRDRFANWPVVIEELSRFRSASEQEDVLQRVAAGKVDILIGTHKLFHASIDYKHLGLLIIDEEHRFGVRQKDAIKALRAHVDILTLTATPIPRTLNLSMSGVRDLSIIATPPAKRLSVKTFVRQYDRRIVREAVLREILRSGQVYYLHNDVKTINKSADQLQSLVPEARINIAHGQMRERELEKVMSDFYHQRFNILVCSTIIETGIDVPSANTIIIERADKFGLAQLHQLRGRVGRSHHQAYAYLLTPEERKITPDAERRLEVIQSADHLGAGFTLATHDLEIRGAGELLGENQSGHIQSIGFSLYIELLERAIQAIRNGQSIDTEIPLNEETEINLNIPALIPDDYLPDINTRLTTYKRIANADTSAALKELQVEMIDRFGLLPEYAKNLFRVTELKLLAHGMGIKKLDAGPTGGRVEFDSSTTVEPITIVQMVQKQPDVYRLQGASELRFTTPMKTVEERFETCHSLLNSLSATNNRH